MDKSFDLLRSLGFSENETRIYLHLLEKPEGRSLEDVIADCNLTSHETQEAIGRLVEIQALRVVSNRFEAVPPRHVLARIVTERERKAKESISEARETASILNKSLEPLYWERRLGLRPEEIIEPLESLRAMEVRTVRIIGNTRRSVVIFAETFGWYEKVREELMAALDRRVRVMVLMMVLDESSKRRADDLKKLGVEVRHCIEEWYPVRGTLSDNSELVFLIWATKKKAVPRPIHYRPHYTMNQGLIKVFTDAFEKRWEEAKPV